MLHFDRLYGVDFGAGLQACLEGGEPGFPEPVQGPMFLKFPEILQLAMQGGLGSLLKNMGPPVKMPLAPPGDPLIGLRSARDIVLSQAKVTLGRWRSAMRSFVCGVPQALFT
jgi:hypothetical protein